MIGQWHIIGDVCYIEINEGGTYERMEKVPWYWVLFGYIRNRFKKYSLDEAREFYKTHSYHSKDKQ
jgi:hypothetical protein